mgnify:CR=1 FL=1
MNQGNDPASDPARQPQAEASDPYQLLGISVEATFDEVQSARQSRLAGLEDDPMARSRVEAAYDAILMNRLRERQQGRVSTAARSASQREQSSPTQPSRPAPLPLPRFPQLSGGGITAPRFSLPGLQSASGRELWFPLIGIGSLLGLLLLLPAPPAELLLSLATLITLLNLQRRNGRFLAALGWSFALLGLGLAIGTLLLQAIGPSLSPAIPLGPLQLMGLPPLLLLLLGALLIA